MADFIYSYCPCKHEKVIGNGCIDSEAENEKYLVNIVRI